MPKNRVERPIILGVVGDSATGKSTLCKGIADILGRDRVAVICTDDYHSQSRIERAESGMSALDPKGNYMDIIEQHLELLREGKPILKPVYNHDHGTLDRPDYIEPKPYIIVEGLLGYTTRRMRECYDVKIYLDPDEDLRVDWKLNRDIKDRGYTREEVIKSLEKRKDDSVAFIRNQRTFADMIISFSKPENTAIGDYRHLNAKHILRPTLPHPDFTPIMNSGGTSSGIHLELSRDLDGKPVDVLDLNGKISDKRAKTLEDLLWKLIPEASHLRNNIGTIDSGNNNQVTSHPLALTQLLVSYHMVKAAVGEYAL
ncbi:MAG: phosphoribulokinase [Sphingomonadales bacterium]|nr:phosphoribulokinase [Sphingomonadales bacterium]